MSPAVQMSAPFQGGVARELRLPFLALRRLSVVPVLPALARAVPSRQLPAYRVQRSPRWLERALPRPLAELKSAVRLFRLTPPSVVENGRSRMRAAAGRQPPPLS